MTNLFDKIQPAMRKNVYFFFQDFQHYLYYQLQRKTILAFKKQNHHFTLGEKKISILKFKLKKSGFDWNRENTSMLTVKTFEDIVLKCKQVIARVFVFYF